MDKVLDRLWIGGTKDTLAGSTMRAMGFSAVLDLRDRISPGEESMSQYILSGLII